MRKGGDGGQGGGDVFGGGAMAEGEADNALREGGEGFVRRGGAVEAAAGEDVKVPFQTVGDFRVVLSHKIQCKDRHAAGNVPCAQQTDIGYALQALQKLSAKGFFVGAAVGMD